MSMRPITQQISCKASIGWNSLNGIFVIYKPALIHFLSVRETIIKNICKDLNKMNVRPPTDYVVIEGNTNENMNVTVRPNYADDPLVVGPRYQERDITFSTANLLKPDTCGVLICGINHGNSLIHKIRESKPARCYRLKGILGQATDNQFKTGKIVEKSTYEHVKRFHIDKICASMQSSHQKKMFELCGVDIQSQEAYELAVQGLIRPADSRIPVLYEIKCVDFQPPEFTLEIVCINEYEQYLKTLVHELGMEARSTATCTQVQCFKYGLFDLQHALLSKKWDMYSILDNMRLCRKILKENDYLIEQTSPTLIENNK
ncbi:mitochondrial mRNA pseudouridine synthase Trub2 [Polistes fuscatus]|uniref:mitochondrial mRNA pseudouridine synthase Trub2 n=1 Tax=Polistes fuscatus TaxID=30207 RepID=UPI001CA7F106|nr:mitochondrial mRNA pseudouridine synthase Trub2 [Polistes fuscatus]